MSIRFTRGESPTAHFVVIGDLTLFFSYETCVAFAVRGWGWVISENVWSRTTGKHIGQNCPRGVDKTSYALFEKMREAVEASITDPNGQTLIQVLEHIKAVDADSGWEAANV